MNKYNLMFVMLMLACSAVYSEDNLRVVIDNKMPGSLLKTVYVFYKTGDTKPLAEGINVFNVEIQHNYQTYIQIYDELVYGANDMILFSYANKPIAGDTCIASREYPHSSDYQPYVCVHVIKSPQATFDLSGDLDSFRVSPNR